MVNLQKKKQYELQLTFKTNGEAKKNLLSLKKGKIKNILWYVSRKTYHKMIFFKIC